MKIKALVAFQGEWNCNAGEVIDRPKDEAVRLVEAGFAEFVSAADEKAFLKAQADAAALEAQSESERIMREAREALEAELASAQADLDAATARLDAAKAELAKLGETPKA